MRIVGAQPGRGPEGVETLGELAPVSRPRLSERDLRRQGPGGHAAGGMVSSPDEHRGRLAQELASSGGIGLAPCQPQSRVGGRLGREREPWGERDGALELPMGLRHLPGDPAPRALGVGHGGKQPARAGPRDQDGQERRHRQDDAPPPRLVWRHPRRSRAGQDGSSGPGLRRQQPRHKPEQGEGHRGRDPHLALGHVA